MPNPRGKRQALAVALVQLQCHRLGSLNLVDDDWPARPVIHYLALVIAACPNYSMVSTAGVFARRNQKTVARLKVAESQRVRRQDLSG